MASTRYPWGTQSPGSRLGVLRRRQARLRERAALVRSSVLAEVERIERERRSIDEAIALVLPHLKEAPPPLALTQAVVDEATIRSLIERLDAALGSEGEV